MKRLVWQGIDQPSMEYLTLTGHDYGWNARGCIIGLWDGQPYSATYNLEYDLMGEVRRVAWDTGELVQREPGIWSDGEGHERREFVECRTVDIRQTPFTNTLAILYAELGTGMSLEIPVVYINLVTNEVIVVRQRYTCLSWSPAVSRYRFQQDDYTVEFDVDAELNVNDYPGLFTRLYPRAAQT
ncbi:MAG: putative glycolipid-binding domain-containing protein [Chloroflexota bacterium]|nr:putative glycolipid-binding domain-containing protein [Chloroflexota bacterium]